MKNLPPKIKPWILPKLDKETDVEIDKLNINTIYYVSLVMAIIQTLSVTLFLITKHGSSDPQTVTSVIYVSLSVALCAVGFVAATFFRHKSDLTGSHSAIGAFVCIYITLLIIWGMFASVHTFERGEQIITFFTVELITVILLRLHPIFTACLVISSYTVFFLILNIWIKPGMINPYNYFSMGLISVAGSIIVYRTTVNYIEQKNKANRLNDSLEIIAKHDSITRLQNRYALNQRIPEYLDVDICVAMIDINDFKAINDTYGHSTGDEALKAFSDILLDSFEQDSLYRYGGDEFLVVIPSRDLAAFRDRLSELNGKFGEAHISGLQDKLSCCFGCVSAQPHDPTDFFDLVMQADEKLYEEKSKRKVGR